MYQDLPDPTDDDVSYEDVLEFLAMHAFSACANNAHDMADTTVEAHVATELPGYVEHVLDRLIEETLESGPGEEHRRRRQLLRQALREDLVEATYDYAEDNGYNVYVPREEAQ